MTDKFHMERTHPAKLTSNQVVVTIASNREEFIANLDSALSVTSRFEFTEVCDSICGFENIITNRHADILVLDSCWLAACLEIWKRCFGSGLTETRIILICDDPPLIHEPELVQLGFRGVVPITDVGVQITAAIDAVRRGELWLPRKILEKIFFDWKSGREKHRESAELENLLTPRERETLSLVCRGLSNKEIAGQLGIKEDTVKKHLRHIFLKLGVHRRAELIVRQLT